MKLLLRMFSLLTGLLALAGCSEADLLNAFIPRSGYSVHRDIAYGSNPRQKLDIYVPDKPDPSGSVIVFFYGGSWQKGSKDDYRFVGQAFASKGYTTVVADYRLYPEVYFPAFVDDGAKAVAWVYDHIGKYGGNPERMFLAGHSAGAYIAVMLSTDEKYLEAAGGSTAWISGTIGLAGPYDFLPMTDAKLIALFKGQDPQILPITYVKPDLPPMLLVTGEDDEEVGPKNTRNFAARLRTFNDTVTEKYYPGVGHISLVLSLASGFRGRAPTLNDIDAFIRECNDEK